MNWNCSTTCTFIQFFIFDCWKKILKTRWKNNITIFQNQLLSTRCLNEKSMIYCNFDIIIIDYSIVAIDSSENFTIAHDITSMTTNFRMLKTSWMFFTKSIQKHQNLFCEMTRQWTLLSMIDQKSFTFNSLFIFKLIQMIFFLVILVIRFVFISRCLQSEFTSHEELNRVKNIFRNCRSILLNYEWCKMSCNDMNKTTKCQKEFEHLQTNQQSSQLLTNDWRNYL